VTAAWPYARAAEERDQGRHQSLPAATAMDQAILDRVAVDPAFRATANSAVMRILEAKQAYHLMPCR
jgi:hypothetical protein